MQKQNHWIGATIATDGDPLLTVADRYKSVFMHGLFR
jgi:hypothetical protein